MARKGKRKAMTEPMDMPTEAQLDNGSYERRFVTHVETNTKAMAFVSDHDPVERWRRSERLTDTQATAIALVRHLWQLAGISQRTTASYGERINTTGSADHRAINEIEAREDLHRIQGYIPKPYWDCFENCCRWGMPAGVAGNEIGYGSRGGEIRAHQIVVFVADLIAMWERL